MERHLHLTNTDTKITDPKNRSTWIQLNLDIDKTDRYLDRKHG